MKITSPTSRPLITLILPFLFAAACARQYHPTSAEQHPAPSAQAASTASPSAPAADAADHGPAFRIEGIVLAFPEDAPGPMVISDRARQTPAISEETMQTFLKFPEASLLAKPDITVRNDMDWAEALTPSGSAAAKKPRLRMTCHPILLPDGKVRLNTRLFISRRLGMGEDTLANERDIEPDTGGYTLIGSQTSAGQRIYLFLRLSTVSPKDAS